MQCICFFLLFLTTAFACNRISCAAYIGACGGLCTCDLPVCECCPGCIACLGAMWAECCACFDRCNFYSDHAINQSMIVMTDQGMVKQTTTYIPLRTGTICNGASSHVICFRCGPLGGPIQANYCDCRGKACAEMDRAEICCPDGRTATCHCAAKTGVAQCLCK
jgi:hypothetical protein